MGFNSAFKGLNIGKKSKVKCTLVQALRLCTGRTAHRGSRGIALPFLDHDTRRGWGVSVTPRPLFTPGKDPVPIVQEAGWAPGPVWTGAENLAPTGIRSPDRPARSQSLYRLRYPALLNRESVKKYFNSQLYRLALKVTQYSLHYDPAHSDSITGSYIYIYIYIYIYWDTWEYSEEL